MQCSGMFEVVQYSLVIKQRHETRFMPLFRCSSTVDDSGSHVASADSKYISECLQVQHMHVHALQENVLRYAAIITLCVVITLCGVTVV